MKEQLMTTPIDRRSFVYFLAGLVPGYKWIPFHKTVANWAGTKHSPSQNQATRTYVCPPCGQDCDKLTFDKPGNCPNCGMKLIPTTGEGSPPTVAVLLYSGAEIIDFAGPWEAFGTAGFLVHTVAEKREPMMMVFGQKVMPDYTFEDSPKADVLLVPGGGYGQAIRNDRLLEWVKSKSKEVKYVMSVCTGAFILGKAGLLDGQTATCTYGMVEDLLSFPNTKVVYDARYVESGKIITTAGLSSGIDGALHLISRMQGKGEAQRVALGMEYRWDPDANWTLGALAYNYLPRIKGDKILSTEGDADHWETKILMSEPNSVPQIVALLRERIAVSGMGGMSKRISHLRGAPKVSPGNGPEIRWKVTDDQGRDWSGVGVVEPAPHEKDKFILTLKLAHDNSKPAKGRRGI
jgi:putative intracellular protease/amidase/DNA-directed RNA polymerase subunit RPC12/RpoP